MKSILYPFVFHFDGFPRTSQGCGITRLDYLKDTGFETVWISPFFSSPQEDFGYDISGYRSIAPEYGDMDACMRLIEEVHRREMTAAFCGFEMKPPN